MGTYFYFEDMLKAGEAVKAFCEAYYMGTAIQNGNRVYPTSVCPDLDMLEAICNKFDGQKFTQELMTPPDGGAVGFSRLRGQGRCF